MSNKSLFLTIALFISIILLIMAGIIGGWWWFYQIQTPPPPVIASATPVVALITPSVPPLPPTSTPVASLSTEQDLLETDLPIRDQRLIAMRLKQSGQPIPEVVSTTPPELQLGQTHRFWVTDNFQNSPRQFESEAQLQFLTEHSAWWVESGFIVAPDDLKRSAERFERETYPTNRAFFGSEWSPGIDGDVRVHILMGNIPGVAGYFAALNSYSRLAQPYSNEREMFFINLNAIQPGHTHFDAVLAHEFQHMIHWHQDRNEDTWVNEGLSELAAFINGYGPSNYMGQFLTQPNLQLNTWEPNTASHYGASFLFMAYFLEHYGEEAMKAVVANPYNGITGFNHALAEQGQTARFDDIFAQFAIANYLQNPKLTPWGYSTLTAPPVKVKHSYQNYPVEQAEQVYQYATNYIEITHNKPLTIHFSGAPTVTVINNQAYSGRYQWYSHRGDDTNTRLTRAFDLSGVTEATLQYATWYDIETDWDYGYVTLSADEGRTWSILTTTHSSTTNPSGSAYGAGYTGQSQGWQAESVDISAYAGQKIWLRFEYVTDDAVNQTGWAIDDVRIPEIGFSDDMEQGDNDWQAEGFVRLENVLPQHFKVQIIEMGATPTVQTMTLDEANQGRYSLTGLGSSVTKAVLVISGLTPVTTEPASYQYEITP